MLALVCRAVSVALAGSLLFVGSAANAATISFNNAFGPDGLPLLSTALAPLSLFDPALGTLTEVELTLDADAFDGSITWDNEDPVNPSDDVTLGIGAEGRSPRPSGTRSSPSRCSSATEP